MIPSPARLLRLPEVLHRRGCSRNPLYIAIAQGTWTPPVAPVHREADYDSNGFDWLRTMQTRHFWYRGRHRFLLHFTRKTARSLSRAGRQPEAVDLGGGCGGWVRYLSEHAASDFHAIALADSSRTALRLAAGEIPPNTRRYQIDLLNLQRHRNSLVAGLPYGIRKVVEVARALCTKPKLLLLDEPSSGLNPEETDDMAWWINDIRNELGITVLMVEHDMSLVSRVSDRVLAMNQGEVLVQGTPAEVQDHPGVIQAYLGTADDVESLRRGA